MKGEVNLLPFEIPSALEGEVMPFVEYYNYQRYHEAVGDVIPFDVYTGRNLQVLQRRKELWERTLEARKDDNGAVRGQGYWPWSVQLSLKTYTYSCQTLASF